VAGDWALHCHKSHHTMNAMGHDVRNYIGVDLNETRKRIARVVGSDYHPMGSRGMAEMGSMEMPAPDNTLPMMTGFGPFGPIEMGGMFTVVKVREDLAANDYKDPGWYQHPHGTVAYEWQGDRPAPAGAPKAGAQPSRGNTELRAVKPDAKRGHKH
jgi:manganese oxidase